jgi:hypothetical protein
LPDSAKPQRNGQEEFSREAHPGQGSGTEDAMNDTNRFRNPADDYPPTRPTPMILGAVLVIALAVVILTSWSTVSHALHLQAIEAALGL